MEPWTSRDGRFTTGHPLVLQGLFTGDKSRLLLWEWWYQRSMLCQVQSFLFANEICASMAFSLWAGLCQCPGLLGLGIQSWDWGLSWLSHRRRWGAMCKGLFLCKEPICKRKPVSARAGMWALVCYLNALCHFLARDVRYPDAETGLIHWKLSDRLPHFIYQWSYDLSLPRAVVATGATLFS